MGLETLTWRSYVAITELFQKFPLFKSVTIDQLLGSIKNNRFPYFSILKPAIFLHSYLN